MVAGRTSSREFGIAGYVPIVAARIGERVAVEVDGPQDYRTSVLFWEENLSD